MADEQEMIRREPFLCKKFQLFFGYIRHRPSSCTSKYLLCLARYGQASPSLSSFPALVANYSRVNNSSI